MDFLLILDKIIQKEKFLQNKKSSKENKITLKKYNMCEDLYSNYKIQPLKNVI